MIGFLVMVHVLCGISAVLAGAGAMRTAKGSRKHRWLGRAYLGALAGLCGTAPLLAAVDWTGRWHLAVLAGVAAGLAGLGLFGVRQRRLHAHILGMGGSYLVMLTAFYVDNGPRLPLWNQLPAILFWFLPTVIGLPVLLRSVHRRRVFPS